MDLLCRSILITLLLLAGSAEAFSQRLLSLHSLDASSFPTIRARLLATDDAGNTITGLRPEDITVIENGVSRTVTRLVCGAGQMPRPLSIAVSFDLSSSMQGWRTGTGEFDPFTIGQHALRYMANAVPFPRSEMALQGFEDFLVGGIPLVRDRAAFVREVDRLPMMTNNNFERGLFDEERGTLNVVKRGAHGKVAILISDNDACIARPDPALLRRYIDTCSKYSIRFYAIIFRTTISTPLAFQALVDATGGRLYDQMTTRAQAEAAVKEILDREQGEGGCEIAWESLPGCPEMREVTVAIPQHMVSASTSYHAPATALPGLRIEPAGVAFGPMAPGSTRTVEITVTATQFPLTISSVDSIAPPFSIDGLSVPFSLQPGESRKLAVRFTPTDSTLSFGQFRFNRNDCAPVVFDLSGGAGRKPQRLSVVAPNGREKLPAGSAATLRWTGVSPSEPVRLEYSIDRGNQWKTIVERATGLEYQWLVPFTPSDSCLLRVSLPGVSSRRINFLDYTGYHFWCTFSPADTLVAVSNADFSVSLRDASTAVEVRRLVGHGAPIWWVEFSPDGRYLLSASDDNVVIVWDVATGRIVHFLTGHNTVLRTAAFSPDGGRIVASGHMRTIIWSVETGEILREFPNNCVYCGVRFNHDGSQVVVVENEPVIRDAFSGAELHRIPYAGNPTYAEFSSDGSLFLIIYTGAVVVYETSTWKRVGVLGSSDGTEYVMAHFRSGDHAILKAQRYVIELWDAGSQQLLAELPTGGVGGVNAFFSGDRRRIVSVNGATGTIWDLAGGALGADLSDSLWSIVLPEEQPELVGDFMLEKETICQGECIEPVAASIAEATTWEWTFTGGVAARGDGVRPGRICYPTAGRYPVRMIVANATQRDTVIRFVTVIPPPPVPAIAQCGPTLTASAGPRYQWFRDGAPIDGATARELRYDRPGTYVVEVTGPEGCSSRSAPHVADDNVPDISVAVAGIEATPGEIARVPLALRFSMPGTGAPYRLTLRLSFDASILLPIDHAASTSVGGRRSIDITIAGESFRDTVVDVPFHVALGGSPTTLLVLDTVGILTECPVGIHATNGLLELAGLCTDGGVRLVATAEASSLKPIRPNPTRGGVTIRYSLVESGAIDISLFDLSGRRVTTIVSGRSTPGGYVTTYDLAGVPSGRYLCVYTTPTESFSEVVIVE